MDVKAKHTIFRVKDVIPNDILLIGRMLDKNVESIFKNCVLCHLPIDMTLHPELVVVPEGLYCFVCGETEGVATMLFCDMCQQG